MNNQQSAALAPAAAADQAERQGWYLVFTLLIFYIFSFIDRQIISLLVEPIKRDLQVTDTQIGLLQGLAFAIFYTLFGIPIGRLADRMNRKTIVGVGVVIWSLMATLCGLAKNFTQLFLARIGVGVGEAALSPAAYSMITDAFPREKLGRAFSVYNMGIAIGSGTAILVGGLVVAAVSGEGRTFTSAAARRSARVAVRLHRHWRARACFCRCSCCPFASRRGAVCSRPPATRRRRSCRCAR